MITQAGADHAPVSDLLVGLVEELVAGTAAKDTAQPHENDDSNDQKDDRYDC